MGWIALCRHNDTSPMSSSKPSASSSSRSCVARPWSASHTDIWQRMPVVTASTPLGFRFGGKSRNPPQNHIKVIPKSYKQHPNIIRSHPQSIYKSSQHHIKVIPTSYKSYPQNNITIIPKSYKTHPQQHIQISSNIISKSSQHHVNITPKSYKSHTKTL